jgi:hypothetical protein
LGHGEVHTSISAIEQHYSIKYNKTMIKEFSIQQLLECYNLNSSTPSDIFSYIARGGGLALDKYYPRSKEIGKCIFNYTMEGIYLAGSVGHERIAPYDEEMMKRNLT